VQINKVGLHDDHDICYENDIRNMLTAANASRADFTLTSCHEMYPLMHS